MTQQELLAGAFGDLAGTLVAEFDVLDLLHLLADRTLDLLSVDAVGLMLTDQRGELQVMAATSHRSHVLELFELQNSEGPCFDCFHSGQPVVNIVIDQVESRWPAFSRATREAGYLSVHALPLRLGDRTIGAMNLFCNNRSTLGPVDLAVGQALADVATIGLVQEGVAGKHDHLAGQLQTALNNRVLLEQAKGALAEHLGINIDSAFERLRAYAHSTERPLTRVAASVLDGSTDAQELRGG